MSIGLCRIRYISLRGCHWHAVGTLTWMQWPWPSGVVYAETIVTTGQHPGPLDPGPWEIDIRPWIRKLQAASRKPRVIHNPVNNYEFKFDIYRMILYIYNCQLCPICCWFSLYWHNVSKSGV